MTPVAWATRHSDGTYTPYSRPGANLIPVYPLDEFRPVLLLALGALEDGELFDIADAIREIRKVLNETEPRSQASA